jgi:hypothetical protein
MPAGAARVTGGISIPAAAVRAPSGLVIESVLFSPTVVQSRSRAVNATVEVRDTSCGFLVRDAIVSAVSVPREDVTRINQHLTNSRGRVGLRFQLTRMFPRKSGRVILEIRARTRTSANVRRFVSIRVRVSK